MDLEEYKVFLECSTDEAKSVLNTFMSKYSQTFDFTQFNTSGQWPALWNRVFSLLSAPNGSQLYLECLSSIRILSRDNMYLNQTITSEQFDCLLNLANIGPNVLVSQTYGNKESANVQVEALKCLCNLVFNSTACQQMCSKNAAVEGILKRLRTYKEQNVDYEIQYFDMKLLFLITALTPNVRMRVRDHLHGLTYLVETLDMILKENSVDKYLPDRQIDLLNEILKVLFNLTARNDFDVSTEEEEEIQFRRLSCILHDLLLAKSMSNGKQMELINNTVNLLTNIPIACFSELVLTIINPGECGVNCEEHNMEAIDVLLNFLKMRLSVVQAGQVSQQEQLSPVLTALIKCVRCNSLQRRYVRSIVLPPLKDVSNRPEVGDELRNQLCRLLTSANTQVRDLVAEFIFILCKENVGRMIKYTGYGNAAGMFANRGLLGGNMNKPSIDYSSDSEDSDTDEYKRMEATINPVTGCYEPPRSDPFAGMTEEQKEYETMKLVNLMDQLNRQGVIQPCKIGPDGCPVAVEHILELQDELPQQQHDPIRKT